MAFLDDVYMATPPERVGPMFAVVQEELYVHAAIRVHHGKTKVWNQAGVRPVGCNALEQIARVTHPEAVVWTGSMIPIAQQGIKVLGTPIRHPDFVAAQLEAVRREHEVLLNRIPSFSDLQCAWLLLVHCASARACYFLRTLRPSLAEEFARAHDAGLWQCLRNILQLDLHQCSDVVADASTLPLCLGGLGLRSAWRSRVAAHWASWADCLPMIHARHPDVAAQLLGQLEGHPETPCLQEAAATLRSLDGVMGFEPPAWRAVLAGARPPPIQPEEFEPSQRGWQHEAASRVEWAHERRSSSLECQTQQKLW